jgi:hypothetical protein
MEVFPDLPQARRAEAAAILRENPKHNKILYDGGVAAASMAETEERYAKAKHPLVYEAIRRCGGAGKFCEAVGISRQALEQWGDKIPKLRVFQVEILIASLPATDDRFAAIRRKKVTGK